MPEHLRALVVILILSIPLFIFVQSPVFGLPLDATSYKRRRNLWLILTIAAFVANIFWLYIFFAAIFVTAFIQREKNLLAMYCAVLFAVPPISGYISGLGPIEQLFQINHIRLLSIFILLPLWVKSIKSNEAAPILKYTTDYFVLAYLAYDFITYLNGLTFTSALREGVFNSFFDVFLPYYAASRAIRSSRDFREVVASLCLAVYLLAVVAIFEFFRYWALYSNLSNVFGLSYGMGGYLGRGNGNLRATASTGHPIILGYIAGIAAMLNTCLKSSVRGKYGLMLGYGLLGCALLFAMSRGPWVGAAAGTLVLVACAQRKARAITSAIVGMAVIGALISVSPYGSAVYELIPFVGSTDTASADYRQRLFTNAMLVIRQNLLFGSSSFSQTNEMQEMIQGEGIIDLVNTYLVVALSRGLVGFVLFVGVFASALHATFKRWQSKLEDGGESKDFGRGLMAAMAVMLVTIGTSSPIFAIPTVYWLLTGFCVAYSGMTRWEYVSQGNSANHETR